jgi:hypothetical protein
MIQGHFPSQQGPAYHEAAFPSKRWDPFIDLCFIAPDKNSARINHPPKKIPVFAAATEFGPENGLDAIEHCPPQQQITGSAFCPVDRKAGWMSGPLIKPPFCHPSRGTCFKLW